MQRLRIEYVRSVMNSTAARKLRALRPLGPPAPLLVAGVPESVSEGKHGPIPGVLRLLRWTQEDVRFGFGDAFHDPDAAHQPVECGHVPDLDFRNEVPETIRRVKP